MSGFPSPLELGAPAKFPEWRNGQDAVLEAAISSTKRAVVLCCPTGVGKSLVSIAWALLSGKRVAYLTSTKALQRQLIDDFKSIGLVSISGMGNYRCDGMSEDQLRFWRMTRARSHHAEPTFLAFPQADEGPCHEGRRCDLKDKGCLYFDAYRAASANTSKLMVTNYAYWLAINEYGQGLGEFDLLIADEAHHCPEEISSFLSAEVSTWEVENLAGSRWPHEGKLASLDGPAKSVYWADWAKDVRIKVEGRLAPAVEGGAKGRERRHLRELSKKLATIEHMTRPTIEPGQESSQPPQGDLWAVEETQRGRVFEPVWPRGYQEKLFRGIKQVAFTSATVRPKTLHLLGLKDEEFDFHEFPSPFDPAKRPVIHIPTIQMTARTPPDGLQAWVRRIDQIIRGRQDRKGIVHTVSYARARYVLENSRYRDIMFTHESRDARQVIAAFKKAKAPAVLVSPSIHTGLDFPQDQAEYNIVGKIAFPDTRSTVMTLRQKQDPEYPMYLAALHLIQASGRTTRGPEDASETFVIDDQIRWFLPKYRHFFPAWFLESFRTESIIPVAPPRLGQDLGSEIEP